MAIEVLMRAMEGEQEDGFVFLWGKRTFPVVRVPRDQNIKKLALDIKKTVKPRQWARFSSAFQARAAINRGDLFAALNGMGGFFNVKNLSRQERMLAYGGLPEHVAREQNRHLRRAQLVMWGRTDPKYRRVFNIGDGKKLESNCPIDLGILCDSPTIALFAYQALNMLRVCPCCNEPFEPTRDDQDYCSMRCRETFRKRRLRAKAKQGGK